jgi:hypothetical protein
MYNSTLDQLCDFSDLDPSLDGWFCLCYYVLVSYILRAEKWILTQPGVYRYV